MDRWSIAAAGFVVGVVLFANPTLAEDPLEALPDIAAAPEYTVNPPRDFADVRLAAGGVSSQSVAVNPKNPNVFVATYAAGGFCWVRTSSNAGQTWTIAKRLPMLGGKPNCDIPAVLWAPDGSRVYAAYNYEIRDAFDFSQEVGAVVSSSIDNGRTWSSPKIALRYPYEFYGIVSLRLSTPLRASDAKWVYLLCELIHVGSGHTDFARSADRGRSWEVQSDSLVAWLLPNTFASSPSVAGGPGGEILIAWGETHGDPDNDMVSTEHTYIKRSSNYGASFSADVIAVPDIHGDTAIAFGPLGTAHLVYEQNDFYNGRPSYVYSTKAPYTAWSQPIVLSDDISASAYHTPALTVSACGSGASVLHAAWLDDRAGSENYSVYYTRKVAKTGEDWSPNLHVSGTSPVTNYGYPLFAPSIAAGMGTAVGLWGQLWGYNSTNPVYASRVASGVSCP